MEYIYLIFSTAQEKASNLKNNSGKRTCSIYGNNLNKLRSLQTNIVKDMPNLGETPVRIILSKPLKRFS